MIPRATSGTIRPEHRWLDRWKNEPICKSRHFKIFILKKMKKLFNTDDTGVTNMKVFQGSNQPSKVTHFNTFTNDWSILIKRFSQVIYEYLYPLNEYSQNECGTAKRLSNGCP